MHDKKKILKVTVFRSLPLNATQFTFTQGSPLLILAICKDDPMNREME